MWACSPSILYGICHILACSPYISYILHGICYMWACYGVFTFHFAWDWPCGRVHLPFCMGLAAFWHVHLPFCMGFATCWHVHLPFCMEFSTCEHVHHIIMPTPRDLIHFVSGLLARSLDKRPLGKISVRDVLFCASCTVEMHMDISSEPWCVEIYQKMAGDIAGDAVLCEPAQSKFIYMDISQEPYCVKIHKKNGRGHCRRQRFVRACAVEMHMDISQELLHVEIYRENAGRLSRGHCFVRPCAIEMHMDISQEPFCVEIDRKNAKR